MRLPKGLRGRISGEERNGLDRARRWAWPAGVAAAGIAWYAADSLRHRREGAFGYDLDLRSVFEERAVAGV